MRRPRPPGPSQPVKPTRPLGRRLGVGRVVEAHGRRKRSSAPLSRRPPAGNASQRGTRHGHESGAAHTAQSAWPAALARLNKLTSPCGRSKSEDACDWRYGAHARTPSSGLAGYYNAFRDLVQGHSHELAHGLQDSLTELSRLRWRNLGVRPAVLAADVAISDRDQSVPEHVVCQQPTPRIAPPRPEAAPPEPAAPATPHPGWSHSTLLLHLVQPDGGPLRDHRSHLPGFHHRPQLLPPYCFSARPGNMHAPPKRDALAHPPGVRKQRPQRGPCHRRPPRRLDKARTRSRSPAAAGSTPTHTLPEYGPRPESTTPSATRDLQCLIQLLAAGMLGWPCPGDAETVASKFS